MSHGRLKKRTPVTQVTTLLPDNPGSHALASVATIAFRLVVKLGQSWRLHDHPSNIAKSSALRFRNNESSALITDSASFFLDDCIFKILSSTESLQVIR